MNKQDYKYFKHQLKTGNKITLIYDKTASTGEVAMENTFDRNERLKYTAIRQLVAALLSLNHVVVLMEVDEIEVDRKIEEAYRILMARLAEIAESC